jgi:hypothetical protein
MCSCVCVGGAMRDICNGIRKGMHVNCEFVKIVEALFVGQVNVRRPHYKETTFSSINLTLCSPCILMSLCVHRAS